MTLMTSHANPPRHPDYASGHALQHNVADVEGRLALASIGSIDATTGELTHLLFDRRDRRRIHSPWRSLISNETFRHHPERSATERISVCYDWLRMVNDTVDRPEDLAQDPSLIASLHEWAATVDGGGGLCALASIHYNLFMGSLLDHRAGTQRDLSDFTSMRRTGTFLCTELEHGNDVSALETTAELDRQTGGFILNTPHRGAQKFMPNTSTTGGPKSGVVAARLMIDGEDQGVFLFLTPLTDEAGPLPGVTVRRLPLRAGAPVDHCLTSFDHVALPYEAMLQGEHGYLNADGSLTSSVGNRRKRFLQSIGRVTVGKLCMSGAAVGASRAALSIAVRYAHLRHISGPKADERIPVNTHRSHHGRLLDSLATAYAMTFLHRSVVSRWSRHTPENKGDMERLVAIAKGWITWQARSIAIESRERCGAQGLFPANGLSDFAQCIEGTVTAEGDNLVVWVKAASEMLFGHQVEQETHETPPDQRSLTDPQFLRGLLAHVEAIWQTRARKSLRQGPAGDPIARWNAASSSALEMVSVHARLEAADAFLEAAASAVGSRARALLERLCLLFLLQQLGAHTGDLLADGHITVEHVRALPHTVDKVVESLAPHMMTLVDAFDLPAEFLDAVPIANRGCPSLVD